MTDSSHSKVSHSATLRFDEFFVRAFVTLPAHYFHVCERNRTDFVHKTTNEQLRIIFIHEESLRKQKIN